MAALRVRLESPHCFTNARLRGTLHVRVSAPMACTEVVVVVTGNESVSWNEQWTETGQGKSHQVLETIFDSREFFRQKIVLSNNFGGEITPGTYAYPFQYVLPSGLPSSYDNENDQDVQAAIEYAVTGSFCVNGVVATDVASTVPLTVYTPATSVEAPSVAEKVQVVRNFCCFRRGQCDIRVALDKSLCHLGHVPIVQCDIKNSSPLDMRAMRFELVRVVEVFAKGRIRSLQTVLCDELFSGVPAGKQISHPQPFQLHGPGLYPSTSGSFLSCSYYIEVDLDIPSCPIVELRLRLALGAPIGLVASDSPSVSTPSPY
ncbi:hypothetical protein ACHHYP_12449 [Achlya hypogyna]|uniref:Arrestin C-terminal-like domain-containing protein n=1 Tax=Achlya hypogyna TaxID=1202772 RepID=A0A1V9YGZ6_ACHHY|nr:hypothetical protein ACHHYP_12449 [Achlya hypogyna]